MLRRLLEVQIFRNVKLDLTIIAIAACGVGVVALAAFGSSLDSDSLPDRQKTMDSLELCEAQIVLVDLAEQRVKVAIVTTRAGCGSIEAEMHYPADLLILQEVTQPPNCDAAIQVATHPGQVRVLSIPGLSTTGTIAVFEFYIAGTGTADLILSEINLIPHGADPEELRGRDLRLVF